MTLVGKKLQDIYDSGAGALTELQEKATKNFEQAGKEQAQNIKQLTEKSSLSLEDKSSHLQGELKDLMQASLARLESVLQSEDEQNHAFVVSLIAELQTRTEQMKLKLAALGQSHNENVDFAFNVACQHYLSNLETAKINLEGSAAQHEVGITGYGATVADKLLQTSDQAFWQQHEQSQESGNAFFTAAREQEGTVSEHASSLTQTFSNGCQNRLTTAKTLANKATEEVEASIRSLLETIARHANNVEIESNEKYTRLTDTHFQAVDARLSNFADELSNLHDGVTDRLLKNTEELSTDLLSASTQAQEGLRGKCDQSVDSVNSDFTTFKQKLDTRLQLSRGQKQTLEEDKNKILIAIKNELLSIHDSFAKKIASLLGDAKSELANMTKSVEAKILVAMETCNEQVGTSAASVQKQIEDEVVAFLQELSKSRTSAVEEITASAQGNLPLINIPESIVKPAAKIDNIDNKIVEETVATSLLRTEPSELKSLNAPEAELDIDSMENISTDSEATDNKVTKKNRKRKGEDILEKDEIEEK